MKYGIIEQNRGKSNFYLLKIEPLGKGETDLGQYTVLALVGIAFLLALILVSRFSKRTLQSAENRSFSVSKEKKPEDIFRDEGRRREPEQADYELSPEDFFEREETEPLDWEHLFDDLPAEEAERILKESGILSEGQGEDNGGE